MSGGSSVRDIQDRLALLSAAILHVLLSFLGHFPPCGEKLGTVGCSWNNRPSFPGPGNSSVFISRGKEFGHDVDIIFTTLELGMEENLLLAVIKSLEKQVGPKTFSGCICACLFIR